jgi:hypothetical protein
MWSMLVVAVLLVCLAPFLVIRFNQLSLGRSLCAEARRQFDAARATRRGLLPVFQAEASRLLGSSAPSVTALEAAVATASSARSRTDAGAAEHAVTEAAREVAVTLRDRAAAAADGSPADGSGTTGNGAAPDGSAAPNGSAAPGDSTAPGDASATSSSARRGRTARWLRDLHAQLEEHETHISAAVRHHNASVRSYMRRRRGLLSLPLLGLYRPLQEIEYAPSPIAEVTVSGAPSPGAEAYRPGPVAEEL